MIITLVSFDPSCVWGTKFFPSAELCIATKRLKFKNGKDMFNKPTVIVIHVPDKMEQKDKETISKVLLEELNEAKVARCIVKVSLPTE
jgi:hypothetical protein